MPADDLVGVVALDPLRAFVPGHHYACRVEHEDRVVDDAGDEQSKLIAKSLRRHWAHSPQHQNLMLLIHTGATGEDATCSIGRAKSRRPLGAYVPVYDGARRD